MGKFYFETRCRCEQRLRVEIRNSDFGEVRHIKCPTCSEVNRIEIPLPAKKAPRAEVKMNDPYIETVDNCPQYVAEQALRIAKRMNEDEEIIAAVDELESQSYLPVFSMEVVDLLGPERRQNSTVEPLVDDDGNIKPGTFNRKDFEELSKFKIKL